MFSLHELVIIECLLIDSSQDEPQGTRAILRFNGNQFIIEMKDAFG